MRAPRSMTREITRSVATVEVTSQHRSKIVDSVKVVENIHLIRTSAKLARWRLNAGARCTPSFGASAGVNRPLARTQEPATRRHERLWCGNSGRDTGALLRSPLPAFRAPASQGTDV